MKCPNCGNPRLKYVVSRKGNWKGKSTKGLEPRTDFTVKCKKCGFKGKV